jgi:hypothetical protein
VTTYILERIGWNQWMDEGGRWQGNREAAREFTNLDEADSEAEKLNEEFGEDDVVVVAATTSDPVEKWQNVYSKPDYDMDHDHSMDA